MFDPDSIYFEIRLVYSITHEFVTTRPSKIRAIPAKRSTWFIRRALSRSGSRSFLPWAGLVDVTISPGKSNVVVDLSTCSVRTRA